MAYAFARPMIVCTIVGRKGGGTFSNPSSMCSVKLNSWSVHDFPGWNLICSRYYFSVNMLGKPLQDQSLEQLVPVTGQGDGSEPLCLR